MPRSSRLTPGRPTRQRPNLLVEDGIRFTAFGSGGNLALTTQIRSAALADGSQTSGLECGVELRCDLDVPADQVRVMISSVDDRVTVAGLDASNRIVAQQLVGQRLRIVEVVLVAPGSLIARVVVKTREPITTLLHRLCREGGRTEIHIDAYDAGDRLLSRTLPTKALMENGQVGSRNISKTRGPWPRTGGSARHAFLQSFLYPVQFAVKARSGVGAGLLKLSQATTKCRVRVLLNERTTAAAILA